MKNHPFLVTAAAGVVAALIAPTFAHAWRSPHTAVSLAKGAPAHGPMLPCAALQQDAPEGTRRLAPSEVGSSALPRGGTPATTPAPRAGTAPQADEPPASLDVAALFAEPDLALRERHFEAVVARALEEPAVRGALETLAEGVDPALAWTARLALREVRARPNHAAARPRALDPISELERLLGGDPFGDPFFARPFGAFGRSPFAPPQPGDTRDDQDPFERMRAEFLRLEELMARPPLGGSLAPGGATTPRGGGLFQGRSESLSVTPDGVRLEVEEDGPDGRTTRTYEARTLDELYTAHPELKKSPR